MSQESGRRRGRGGGAARRAERSRGARADRTHRETARRIINSLLFAFAPVVGVIAPILALVANLRGGGKIEQSDVSMASALVAAAETFSC